MQTDDLDRRDTPLFDLHVVKVGTLGRGMFLVFNYIFFNLSWNKLKGLVFFRSSPVHLPYWGEFKHIGPMPAWLLSS